MNDKKRLSYVMENFRLQYVTEEFSIAYDESEGDICIKKGVASTFFEQQRDIDPEQVVWKEWKGFKIPCWGMEETDEAIITMEGNRPVIHIDIVFGVFYFLSGWSEYLHKNKDALGRVTYKESMICRLGLAKVPVVNLYFDILSEALTLAGITNKRKQPYNVEFTVVLTHDIDQCQSGWLEGGFSELKRGRLLSVARLLWKRVLQQDDWFNFEKILATERSFGASSTFYFLPARGRHGGLKNADYNIRHKKIRKAIRRIREAGHEVGVHGSTGSHLDAALLKRDIARLELSAVTGNRFHYLMFDPGKTVRVLEQSGIKYDSSLMFAEQIGFRRGCCAPFYLYNFEENRISPVVEIPLIVMDTTLRNRNYMGVSREKVLEEIVPLLEVNRQFNGVLTLLWHNNFFSDYKYTGWRECYIEILRYISERRAWLANGEQVYTTYTHG